jgi:gamma-glutamyl hydrolase
MHTLRTKNVTMNLHHDGVDPSQYTKNAKLSGLYNLISTNVDRKGKPFGSTLEGKIFPIYAVQWHPERNQYAYSIHLIDFASFRSQISRNFSFVFRSLT